MSWLGGFGVIGVVLFFIIVFLLFVDELLLDFLRGIVEMKYCVFDLLFRKIWF